MPEEVRPVPPQPAAALPPGTSLVVVEPRRASFFGRLLRLVLALVFICSLLLNIVLLSAYSALFSRESSYHEQYHSGDRTAKDKIALIRVSGTIMPPFTERIIKSIEQATKDDNVKAVLLSIDSPGGFVADSHQIYHRLVELREKKPIYVSMKRIAASGGYYIAMGAGKEGKIFAEPTTWTGSIGVILPRYEAVELAEKVGVQSKPIKTGPFKDALSPFRHMTEDDPEAKVWDHIIDNSFQRFLKVISDNRAKLDYDKTKALATGQIYTADDAIENGLVDEIGFEEDALASLKTQAKLDKAQVIVYEFPASLADLLLSSAESQDPVVRWRKWVEASAPQAMYLYSSVPSLPLPGM
jgi:protease-4